MFGGGGGQYSSPFNLRFWKEMKRICSMMGGKQAKCFWGKKIERANGFLNCLHFDFELII